MDQYNSLFWRAINKLVAEANIVIDRPKGSRHPKYPELIYPVDYGYLENTSSMDGGGIDVWQGTDEIKILIGCSEEEKEIVMQFHNGSEFMKGAMIRRIDKC